MSKSRMCKGAGGGEGKGINLNEGGLNLFLKDRLFSNLLEYQHGNDLLFKWEEGM